MVAVEVLLEVERVFVGGGGRRAGVGWTRVMIKEPIGHVEES